MGFGDMLNNMMGQNQYGQQPYNQQGYQQNGYQYNDNQQNYNYQQQQMNHEGNWKLETFNELYCKCTGFGTMFAKKGAMVAYEGNVKFSKRLLGTNDGNIVGQMLNHASRKLTGENLEIMEIKALDSTTTVYLADFGAHCVVIDLEPSGPWSSICVESEDLLAFHNCHYGVTPLGVGVISQKGLFTSKLTYNGPGSQVCVKTNGNPLVLTVSDGNPVCVDPDACTAFTLPSPQVVTDVGLKTLIGQTSGESYQYKFSTPGQIVIVQPYERESGISIRDTNRPKMQSSPRMGNSGQSGSFAENQLGNMLDQLL